MSSGSSVKTAVECISSLLRWSDMNHHLRLLLLCVRGLSTHHPDKVGIDEHVARLLESTECAVSVNARDGCVVWCSDSGYLGCAVKPPTNLAILHFHSSCAASMTLVPPLNRIAKKHVWFKPLSLSIYLWFVRLHDGAAVQALQFTSSAAVSALQ